MSMVCWGLVVAVGGVVGCWWGQGWKGYIVQIHTGIGGGNIDTHGDGFEDMEAWRDGFLVVGGRDKVGSGFFLAKRSLAKPFADMM